MKRYIIETPAGERVWWADDAEHAREQHIDTFGVDDPTETILDVMED